MHTDTLQLADLLRILRRRWAVVVCITALVGGLALTISLVRTQEYRATAKLLFRDSGFDQRLFGSPVLDAGTDADREAQTNVELVSLDVVADRTATALSIPGRDGEELESQIEVEPEGQSDVVAVSVNDSDPTRATDIADEFAEQFIAFRREADRSKVDDAIVLIEEELQSLTREARNGREGRDLREQLAQLQTLSALQTGNAELVQPAVASDSPVTPQTVRNTAFGFLLGLVAGVGAAVLLDRFDRRLRKPEEFEDALGLPVLAPVPLSPAIASERDGRMRLPPDVQASFSMLQTRLRYFNVDRDLTTILISSAAPGEGKSTVSSHLALTAAASGEQVLLMEVDTYHNTLAERFGVPAYPGLSEVLSGVASLDEALTHVPAHTHMQTDSELAVLASGETPPNPVALMESQAMADLLLAFRDQYSLVVIDTAPLSLVADTIPLITRVDGVLIVARPGLTTRDSLVDLRQQLDRLNAPVLGVVANGIRAKRYGYGYGYGYGVGAAQPGAAPAGRPVEEDTTGAELDSVSAVGESRRSSGGAT